MKLMAQYIDKSAVIEWVKKQKATNKALMDDSPYHDGLTDSLDELLSFIDTLEVNGVDLEKELDFVKDAYYYFTSDERSSMKKVAKHFFELGLKA